MIVTEDLIRHIEWAEAERLGRNIDAAGFDVLRIDQGVAGFCGNGSPATQCLGMGHDASFGADQFDQIISFYRGRCAGFEFKVSPVANLDWRDRVVRSATSLPEFESQLVFDLYQPIPEVGQWDFHLVPPTELSAFAERAAAWFADGTPSPKVANLIASFSQHPATEQYEVILEDRPVAACGFSISQDVAGLIGASVHPEFRGRGIHRAMQAFRLKLGVERGCRYAYQGALPGSISEQNACRNGFFLICTRPTFWVAPPNLEK